MQLFLPWFVFIDFFSKHVSKNRQKMKIKIVFYRIISISQQKKRIKDKLHWFLSRGAFIDTVNEAKISTVFNMFADRAILWL